MANLIRISEYNVYFALSEFELLAQLTECILIIFRPSTTCTVPLTTQVLRTATKWRTKNLLIEWITVYQNSILCALVDCNQSAMTVPFEYSGSLAWYNSYAHQRETT